MTGTVAADTNIIRQSTPRRYLTCLEGLRNRRIAVLPMVRDELDRHLPAQASEHIRRLCERDGKGSPQEIDTAARAASRAAGTWWQDESARNSSAYMCLADMGQEAYNDATSLVPGSAFTEENGNDRLIYAQAMLHGIDVLASRNRRTVLQKVLEEHFAKRGQPEPPVTIRGLYGHTCVISKEEGRPVTDVAVEAMLGAVVPEGWSPRKADDVLNSCFAFMNNIAVTEGRNTMLSEENMLVHLLEKALEGMSEERFVQRCEETHASRPKFARDTEMRYHETVRKAVEETGINP